jgi:hypothetical protein
MSQNTEIGRAGETVYSFPRNENGMYEKEGGIPDVETKLNVKYAKQGRFSFGIASVELSNGTLDGSRCDTFDYSRPKTLLLLRLKNYDTGGSKKGKIIENRREVVGEEGTLTWSNMGG